MQLLKYYISTATTSNNLSELQPSVTNSSGTTTLNNLKLQHFKSNHLMVRFMYQLVIQHHCFKQYHQLQHYQITLRTYTSNHLKWYGLCTNDQYYTSPFQTVPSTTTSNNISNHQPLHYPSKPREQQYQL